MTTLLILTCLNAAGWDASFTFDARATLDRMLTG